MGDKSRWVTPFTKQLFVSLGVTLNLGEFGMVMAYPTVLLPQLRIERSSIPIGDSSGSWIASVPSLAFAAAIFIAPLLNFRFGRKGTNLITIIPIITGWLWISYSTSVLSLILARLLQGLSLGVSVSTGPSLIGEYCSPKYRGAFLATVSTMMTFGTFSVHVMSLYLSWQVVALVCAGIAFTDLLIVLNSPESPSWLAEKGRYDDSRKVFHWLRGDDEDIELEKIIDASEVLIETKSKENRRFSHKLEYLKGTLTKKEFYKPLVVMTHLYFMQQWAGINILAPYALDVFHKLSGHEVSNATLLISLNIQRLISNSCAVFVIKKVARRTVLFSTCALNIAVLLGTAAYSYLKEIGMLGYDNPLIGVVLTHILMFTLATGILPLPFILAGEVFPLEYRSISGAIMQLVLCINIFLSIKTLPFLFETVGLSGAYVLYAGIVLYCILIAWFLLPETKDRTLQDIEEEFRGKPLSEDELKSAQSLTTWEDKS